MFTLILALIHPPFKKSEFFTDSDIERAQKVRKLQQHIYWQGTSKFKNSLQEGMICNCPLNPEYPFIANHIYGPARPLLQGGMKRRRNPVDRVPRVPLWTDISLHHNNIKVYFVFLYEKIPFLHTNSSKVTFFAAEIFISKIVDTIIKQLKTVNIMYKEIG